MACFIIRGGNMPCPLGALRAEAAIIHGKTGILARNHICGLSRQFGIYAFQINRNSISHRLLILINSSGTCFKTRRTHFNFDEGE